MHGVGTIPADFCRHELARLPFRSLVIGSGNDPYCTVDEAQELAGHWGADFVLAGDVGHINSESGHGPWPEGSMRLAGFLRSLG
jgi:predicted alpha/beta hydrolase family esterase